MNESNFLKNIFNKAEKITKSIPKSLRWTAIGAALLVSACNNNTVESESSSGHENKLWNAETTNAFPTDSAEMNTSEQAKFTEGLVHFLDEHNNSNGVKELAKARIMLEVSSDERETKKWEGGNEALSEARARTMKNVYYHLIDSLRSKYPDLSGFMTKRINTKIAVSPEAGRGVTSCTQLINPATQKHYTKQELEQLSKEELVKLYDQCRYVKIAIELPSENEHVTQYAELVKILSDFPKSRILIDASPSMNEEHEIFSQQIAEALVKDSVGFAAHDNKIVAFSDQVDWNNYQKLKGSKDVENYMQKLRSGSGNEHQLLSVNQMLDNLDTEYTAEKKDTLTGKVSKRDASAIVMLSDEGINDFSLEQLKATIAHCEKSNTTVFFALINDQSDQRLITMIDAKGLLTEFSDFVISIDDVFFPKDTMSYAEKEAFIFEAMNQQATYRESTHGVQLDENGNINFKLAHSTLKDGIHNRIKGERNRIEQFYKDLMAKRDLEYMDIKIQRDNKIISVEKHNELHDVIKDKYDEIYEKEHEQYEERRQVLFGRNDDVDNEVLARK